MGTSDVLVKTLLHSYSRNCFDIAVMEITVVAKKSNGVPDTALFFLFCFLTGRD